MKADFPTQEMAFVPTRVAGDPRVRLTDIPVLVTVCTAADITTGIAVVSEAEVARCLYTDQQSVSSSLRVLEECGYVRRLPDGRFHVRYKQPGHAATTEDRHHRRFPGRR